MRTLVWLAVHMVFVGISIGDDKTQQPTTATHEGYVDCSSAKNNNLIPVYLKPCQQPVGNLACGQELVALERDGASWLKISTPDGISRYIRSSSVSQLKDKFVPFNEQSGVPEGSEPECSPPIYKIGGDVSPPYPVFRPDPEYDNEARKAGYQGSCELQLIVGTDGKTHDIKVVRPIGHGLDEKAVEAVKRWKFTPALKAGKPVAVLIEVVVSFRLYNPPK